MSGIQSKVECLQRHRKTQHIIRKISENWPQTNKIVELADKDIKFEKIMVEKISNLMKTIRHRSKKYN